MRVWAFHRPSLAIAFQGAIAEIEVCDLDNAGMQE
jgi:hypothetical protein